MCDSHELIRFAWNTVVWNFTRYRLSTGSELIASWSAVIRRLIEQGADVCQPTNNLCSDSSAYLDILLVAVNPVDADERVHEWLRTLKSCGVLIGPYIERETRTIYKHWVDCPRNDCIGTKRLVIVQFGGIPIPSWKWGVSPGDEAFELLEEFGNLVHGDIYRDVCPPLSLILKTSKVGSKVV